MKKNHWYKHDANDWLADVELRRCSLKARGLLEDLICMAHNTEPYGYIDIGCQPSDQEWVKELAMTVRCHHKECSTAWQELVKRRRIGVDKDGNAYIPRMVSDHAYSLQQSNFGKGGGNPAITQTLKGSLNPEVEEIKKKRRVDKKKSTPNPKKKLTDTQKAERIYKEYPKKVGRAKAITSIVAALNNGADANIVINAVIAYGKATKTWPAEDKQYIPNPATWFNQERWTDDQDEWRSKAQVVTGAEYVVATQGDG